MKRGFTLFEVLIALVIFFLLAGGIFTSVRSAFTASNQVATSQLDAERMNAFQSLLRKMFGELPADAKVEIRVRQEAGRGDVVELMVWPAPTFLQFGSSTGDGAALSALPDGRGNFRISLATFRADRSTEERDRELSKARWLPLLPEVAQVRWKFAPMRNPVLTDTWNAGSGRPGLAELTLRMVSGDEIVSAYWIPPLQRRSVGGGFEAGGNQPPPPNGDNPPPADGGPPEPPNGAGEESGEEATP